MSEVYDYKGVIFIVRNAEKYLDKLNEGRLDKIRFYDSNYAHYDNYENTPYFLLFENEDDKENGNKYCLATYTYFYKCAECDERLAKGFNFDHFDEDDEGEYCVYSDFFDKSEFVYVYDESGKAVDEYGREINYYAQTGCSSADPGICEIYTDSIILHTDEDSDYLFEFYSDFWKMFQELKKIIDIKDLVCIEFPYFPDGYEYLSDDDVDDLIKIISYVNDTDLNSIINHWGENWYDFPERYNCLLDIYLNDKVYGKETEIESYLKRNIERLIKIIDNYYSVYDNTELLLKIIIKTDIMDMKKFPKGYELVLQYFLETDNEDAKSYLKKNALKMIRHFINENESEYIYDITTKTAFITKRNIQKLINYSTEHKTTEITAMLMDYKHKHFSETESEDEMFKKFEI